MNTHQISESLKSLLNEENRFQQLTQEDIKEFGTPKLIFLEPPITDDPICNIKRQNWIDWRAASYPAKRHSEYLFNSTRDIEEPSPKVLISAVLPPKRDVEAYFVNEFKDRRKIRKAQSLGYYAQPIAPKDFSQDIWEIIHSSEERQGRKIANLYANRPKEWSFPEYISYQHPAYQDICVGVFDKNDKLVAYLLGKRAGDHVQYDEIMGHYDHIANNVVHLLHLYFLEECSKQEVFPTCLNYGPWYSGENPYSPLGGLNAWKRRVGFHPAYLILASS